MEFSLNTKGYCTKQSNFTTKQRIQTDELDEFEVKAVIAADGVNSEIAEITGVREKFYP